MYASGKKTWNVYYRSPTQRVPATNKPVQRRPRIGTYPVHSLAAARQEAAERLRLVASGIDPEDKRNVKLIEPETIFSAAAAEFIDRYARPRNKDWRETKRIFDYDVLSVWGSKKIGDIARGDVLELIDSVADRGAPYMANAVLAAVRKLFNWAVERGYIDTSPVAGVRAPTRTVQRDRVLTDDEIRAIWRASMELGYPFGPFVQLLMITAQRRGEAAAAQWSEFNLANAVWSIPGARNKSGRSHSVPLAGLAMSIIEPLPRLNSSQFLFTTCGTAPISGFSKAKKRIDELSGVTDWRFHDLRRTAASAMARLGTPVDHISMVLNHRTGGALNGITGIYVRHSFEPEKRAALDGWCRHLLSLNGN